MLETEQLINIIERDIHNVDRSQKGAATEKMRLEKMISTLQTRERPKTQDNEYLMMAHNFFETKDKGACMSKVKNKAGQSPFPQKNVQVQKKPLPATLPKEHRFTSMIDNYHSNKIKFENM